MNWQSEIEKNCEALRRILATLVAMVAVSGRRPVTLPRHLHRFALRLLRPAESAVRRLIVLAARAMTVEIPLPRFRDHAPSRRRDRAVSSLAPSLPMFDPLVRSGSGGGYLRGCSDSYAGPWGTFLGQDDHRLRLSPQDPLNASRLQRRIKAVERALSDVAGHAIRLARWQARRNALALLEDEAKHSRAPVELDNADGRDGSEGAPIATAPQERRQFRQAGPILPGSRPRQQGPISQVLNAFRRHAVALPLALDTS